MVFKCKVCGGNLNVLQGERVTICEYCGVSQTLPSLIEPKAQDIYNRANNYLMHNEFDKAEALYNQILVDNKADADAYWNILMCHYGVTYVKDPASGKYIPTCNRTLYKPIFSDENYQNAIRYADTNQRTLYEGNAKTIDKIQQGIIAVSKYEKPFDIFISYKETDTNNGVRTKDSIKAQELYDKLTAEGYKVFFSRITLEDKIGTEYEPYIYAALASSKVMITICSSKENIEAVWVKNEWSRFLSFASKDNNKTIIPLYFDMNKFDLPEDFANIPAYDMNVDGFEQDLIRGIKKLIPTPVMLAEKRKKFRKKLKVIGVASFVLIIIGAIASIPWFMKLPEYNAAMELYYDKNYPEASWAFEELGNYRNSEELQDMCEKSWRKSLSTVVTTNWEGAKFAGTYYIDSNGNLQNADSYAISSDLSINNHGKVTSLSEGNYTYVLYEDGYVKTDENEWNNIVQLNTLNGNTLIGLRSDGTLIFKDISKYDIGISDDWIEPIQKWENIVSFSCIAFGNGYENDYSFAVIKGKKSDGSTVEVIYDNDSFWHKEYQLEYKNPKYSISDENMLIDNSTNMVILKDIIHMNGITDCYAISRNGSVYQLLYGDEPQLLKIKVCVYDEWLGRVKKDEM